MGTLTIAIQESYSYLQGHLTANVWLELDGSLILLLAFVLYLFGKGITGCLVAQQVDLKCYISKRKLI